MLSVVITALNEPYLQETIDSVFDNARGEVECIAILDGYRPEVRERKDLILIYHPEPHGQRQSINEGARLARGKYFMKLDAHCLLDEGYDLKLAESCKPDWTVIPRRHGIKQDGWRVRPRNIDYMRLTCPTELNDMGLRAIDWKECKSGDDVMTCQGSGWFQYLDKFREHGCLDEGHGSFGAMGCEVGCKAWLSGGRLVVNKGTWYAHWQRGRYKETVPGKTYIIKRSDVRKAQNYAIDLWMNNKWPLQKKDFKWLLNKFQPVPGWKEWTT